MVTAVDIVGGNLCIIGSSGDDIDRFTRLRHTGALGRYVSDKANLHCGAWWVEETIHHVMMTGLLFHIVCNKLVVTHHGTPVYFFIRIDDTWDDQDAVLSLVNILKWNKEEIAATATAAWADNKPQEPVAFKTFLQEEEHDSKRSKTDDTESPDPATVTTEPVKSSGKDKVDSGKDKDAKTKKCDRPQKSKAKKEVESPSADKVQPTDDKEKDDKAPDVKEKDDKAPNDKAPDDKAKDDKAPDDKAKDDKAPDDPKADDASPQEGAASSGFVSDEVAKLQQLLQQKEDEHAEILRLQEEKHKKSLANQNARQRRERQQWEAKAASSQQDASAHKSEVQRLTSERDEAKKQQTAALQKAEQYKQFASSPHAAAGLKHPKELIQMLCETATQTYTDLALQLKTQGAAAPPVAPSEFQFYNGSTWIDLTDSQVVAQLQILRKSVESGSPVKVSYSFNNHSYEAEYNTSSTSTDDKYIQLNTAPQFLTKRWIRDTPPQPVVQKDDAKMTQDIKSNVLFGHNAPLPISTSDILSWLHQYDFNVSESVESFNSQLSLSLAKLATTFASFGSQFNYLSSDPSKCRCESFVKPVALKMWLKLAESRGYTNARVVMHGGSTAEYDAIKNDTFGFNMRYASNPYMGQRGNGAAHGQGIYFGLSDHVTRSYNTDASRGGIEKTGSGILSLFLSEPRLDIATGSYTVFSLSHPDPQSGLGNCVVVHELPLILALGKIVPADP